MTPWVVAEPGAVAAARRSLAERRAERVAHVDSWLRGLVELPPGFALAAVGGLGRGELAPRADLDLVLLHEPGVSPGDLPDRIWYPIWDAGYRLDYSVRTAPEARRLATSDIKVLLGLLDLRPVAGDDGIVSGLRSSIVSDWQGLARKRIGELRSAAAERARRHGSVAHLLEPELKESSGGMRDTTVLRAIAAASLADLPHLEIDPARAFLLDVRDAIQAHGTNGNKLLAQDRGPVADILGFGDGDELLRTVASAGRSIEIAADEVWHRVDRLVNAPRWRPVRRRAERVPLASGVVVQDNEVMLALDARPSEDPVLVLRAAAAAAQSGRRLSPFTVERLARESAPVPVPWPADALDELVSLIGAGPALIPVWESLDQAGVVTGLIPEWEHVRSRPQHSPVHRFALDRHLIETAASAAAGTRDVSRPDLLLLGALFHDIGKGRPGDHSEAGAQVVETLLPRLGAPRPDVEVVTRLVRHHLLLADTATRRDLDDPATVAAVAAAVVDHDTLDLLHALTVADAAATGPGAWSEWKARLVGELVARTHAALAGRAAPPRPTVALPADGSGVEVALDAHGAGWEVTVVADDRVGLLAAVSGVLARHRLGVRSATTETIGARAATRFEVHPLFGDPPPLDRLRADLRAALAGGGVPLPPAPERRPGLAAPRVTVVPDASARATVIEVRAHDEPGLLHRIATALTQAGVDVVAARISTFGAEAVDAFYAVGPDGQPLTEAAAGRACASVTAALLR